jgi:hypothetical protein
VTFSAALFVLVLGVAYGTYSPAASDAYGYVSEADLIARGQLRVDHAFAHAMPWRDAHWSFVPPGYTLSPDRQFLVPKYAAGLPLVMAAFQRATADRRAAFYVVPLLGALAVWMTGQLGRHVHDPLTGAVAAVLFATSPNVLYQVMQPVSDLPAAAWWTLCLVLAVQRGAGVSAAAGVAASIAILTRPNLLPVAATIGAFYLYRVVRADAASRRRAIRDTMLFAAMSIPGCIAVGAINNHLYGSPLSTGYGPTSDLYSWEHVAANLDRYPRFLLETQSPFIFLALLAPLVVRRMRAGNDATASRVNHPWLLLVFSAAVCGQYFLYFPFERDNWTYLRFFLPAYPALLVLSVVVGRHLLGVLRRWPVRAVVAIAVLATVSLAAWQLSVARDRSVFALKDVERRYIDVGEYAVSATPPNAIFFAGLHAGSLRYYTGRLTINIDLLGPRLLDHAVESLTAMGFQPYLVLEDGEEGFFRERFAPANQLGQLDWPPRHQTYRGIRVGIWDPTDRQPFLNGAPVITGDIHLARPHGVTQK